MLLTAVDSAICVVKILVYHSKTKQIEIRHHFIRDSYEKKLIEMVKIHIDYNVLDLLTKAFDVTRISKIECLLSSEVLFERRPMMSIMHSSMTGKFCNIRQKVVGTLRYLSLVVPLTKVGDEAVHKELGDRMERAAITASSFKAE
ncbi:hypothetical protein Tco_1120670 [Tanacetum coccineum]